MFINFGTLHGTTFASHLFLKLKKKVLYSFEEDIAPKNVIPQPSKRKTFEFASKESTNAILLLAIENTGVMRSMTKAVASIILNQQVVTPAFQSCKNQNFDSNLPADGAN